MAKNTRREVSSKPRSNSYNSVVNPVYQSNVIRSRYRENSEMLVVGISAEWRARLQADMKTELFYCYTRLPRPRKPRVVYFRPNITIYWFENRYSTCSFPICSGEVFFCQILCSDFNLLFLYWLNNCCPSNINRNITHRTPTHRKLNYPAIETINQALLFIILN